MTSVCFFATEGIRHALSFLESAGASVFLDFFAEGIRHALSFLESAVKGFFSVFAFLGFRFLQFLIFIFWFSVFPQRHSSCSFVFGKGADECFCFFVMFS